MPSRVTWGDVTLSQDSHCALVAVTQITYTRTWWKLLPYWHTGQVLVLLGILRASSFQLQIGPKGHYAL